MIRFVYKENNYVNYKIMKTIKELEKEIMQARIKAILKQYQNGEFAREAEIMHARMSVADSEKEIPLREKLYRIFGIFGRKDEYYGSFPQILHEELIKGDYLKRLACRLSIFAVFLLSMAEMFFKLAERSPKSIAFFVASSVIFGVGIVFWCLSGKTARSWLNRKITGAFRALACFFFVWSAAGLVLKVYTDGIAAVLGGEGAVSVAFMFLLIMITVLILWVEKEAVRILVASVDNYYDIRIGIKHSTGGYLLM